MGDFGQSILSSSIALLALLVIMGIAYTVWSQVAMRKKRAYFEKLHAELATGQQIIFCGGIYGTVEAVRGDRVSVKVSSGAIMDVSRYAVQQIAGH
ncbi:YajC family protein [Coriobacterium glomerans PW2]|uniref:YajC family protein n=1 Tax=Coriobacterium glomerans (strain ATCC 49209 / DSM 20642 / JCM 10262 / PW2) TaxID=700015 RepID=F2NAJ5_CORGP|nr:preprotein translocase subunit YajC [Coriobacterium glomerans]AEB06522.1 YajC family protein [Coriobacterium glomerans PW2]